MNIDLASLLAEFEPWGLFSLHWKWGKWICQLDVPGYKGPNIRSYVTGEGKTPLEAAEACWSALEDWRASGRMAEDRARAVAEWQRYEDIYANADSWSRNHGQNPVRRSHPLEPERPLAKKSN